MLWDGGRSMDDARPGRAWPVPSCPSDPGKLGLACRVIALGLEHARCTRDCCAVRKVACIRYSAGLAAHFG